MSDIVTRAEKALATVQTRAAVTTNSGAADFVSLASELVAELKAARAEAERLRVEFDGLTEQWGTSANNRDRDGKPLYEPPGPTTYGDTETQAKEHAAKYGGQVWSRLVSPWVRVEESA